MRLRGSNKAQTLLLRPMPFVSVHTTLVELI
jgi:hypothetical protein